MKKFLIRISPFVFASLVIPALVFSQEILIHPKEATHEGNYVRIGQSIEVDGMVTRDVVVVGRSIVVNGAVGGDLIAVGDSVVINAPVSGNIRVVARQLTLNGSSGKNVSVVGESVILTEGARVGWDLWLAAKTAQLNGTVDGSVQAKAESITLGGTVGSTFAATAERTLTVTPSAHVGTSFQYRSPKEIVIPSGAAVPAAQYQPLNDKSESRERRSPFWPLVFLFGTWIVGGLWITLAPKVLQRLAHTIQTELPVTLGWGALVLIATPILVVLFAMTLIGIPLAIILGVKYVILLYMSKIIVGYTLGSILFERIGWKVAPIATMMGGTLLYTLLTALPLVGILVCVFGSFVTFGTVLKNARAFVEAK